MPVRPYLKRVKDEVRNLQAGYGLFKESKKRNTSFKSRLGRI